MIISERQLTGTLKNGGTVSFRKMIFYRMITEKIGSYEEAMEQYETRLIRHMRWMDEHIEDLLFYSHESKNKKFNH